MLLSNMGSLMGFISPALWGGTDKKDLSREDEQNTPGKGMEDIPVPRLTRGSEGRAKDWLWLCLS